MGFIKNWLAGKSTDIYIKEAERALNIVSNYGIIERTETRVGVAVALAFMMADCDRRDDDTAKRLLQAMRGDARIQRKDSASISNLNLLLMNVQKQAFASSSPVNNLIANGIPVWIISNRATFVPEVLPYARTIWSLLDNYDEERYLDIYNRLQLTVGDEHPMYKYFSATKKLETPKLFIAR